MRVEVANSLGILALQHTLLLSWACLQFHFITVWIYSVKTYLNRSPMTIQQSYRKSCWPIPSPYGALWARLTVYEKKYEKQYLEIMLNNVSSCQKVWEMDKLNVKAYNRSLLTFSWTIVILTYNERQSVYQINK